MSSEPTTSPEPESPQPANTEAAPTPSSAERPSGGGSSNDPILAALTYPIPLIGIIILLSDSMKGNPYLRLHAVQSLALGVVLFVLSFILTFIPIVGCLVPLVWLGITIYYAVQAYQQKTFEIPFITNFCRQQNWV